MRTRTRKSWWNRIIFSWKKKKRKEGKQAPEPEPEPGGTRKLLWNKDCLQQEVWERQSAQELFGESKKRRRREASTGTHEKPGNHDGPWPLVWEKKHERRREISAGTWVGNRRTRKLWWNGTPILRKDKKEKKRTSAGTLAGTKKPWWNRSRILTLTHSHSLTHSFTPSLPHPLTPSIPHPLPSSLPHSLTPSLPSLTHRRSIQSFLDEIRRAWPPLRPRLFFLDWQSEYTYPIVSWIKCDWQCEYIYIYIYIYIYRMVSWVKFF